MNIEQQLIILGCIFILILTIVRARLTKSQEKSFSKIPTISTDSEKFVTSYVVIERTGEYRNVLLDNYGEKFATQEEAEHSVSEKNINENTDKYYVGKQRIWKIEKQS